MKRVLTLACIFFLLSTAVKSQCDISNGTFETWVDITDSIETELTLEITHPVFVPEDWYPLARLLEVALSQFILPYFDLDTIDVPIFDGLQPYEPGANGTERAAKIFGDSLFTISDLWQLTPCNNRPEKLTGYYKFTGTAPDSLIIAANLYSADYQDESDAIGVATFVSIGGPADFEQFEMPITYFSEETPDTLILAILTIKDEENPLDSSYFVIDEISFDNATPVLDNAFEAGFSVYPNPTQDFINVDVSNKAYKEVQLIDPVGRVVKHWNINATTDRFDIANLSNGIYYLKAVADTQIFIHKLIKN